MHRFKVLVAVALGAALLSACEKMTAANTAPNKEPAACAPKVERTIAFTATGAADKLIVEALGPDCANAALFARLYDPAGRLIYAQMTSAKFLLNTETFPAADGTLKGVTEAIYALGEQRSSTLPEWKEGTSGPSGQYAAFAVGVPQPAYERFRKLDVPMLYKYGEGESGTIYVYNPDFGEAMVIAEFAT